MSTSFFRWASVGCAGLLLSGCIFSGGPISVPDLFSQPDTSSGASGLTIMGVVYGPDQQPLAGVSAQANGVTALSDASGQFSLAMSQVDQAVVVLSKTGYAPAYRAVKSGGGALATVSAALLPISVQSSVVPAAGGTVDLGGGVKVVFPAGALVNAQGQVPASAVPVAVTWLPPDKALENPPFLLQAYDGNELVPLETYGMIDISVGTPGQMLQIAAGKSAQLQAPAKTGDPESVGLFYGNPATGLWQLEGAVANLGGVWTAQLPHLSWWNIDGFLKVPKDQRTCVTFRARSKDAKPIAGVEIKSAWGPNNKYTIAGGTDPNGELCNDKFPGGSNLTVNWKSYMNVGATAMAEGFLSVNPTQYGAQCGTPACQIIDIPIECTKNSHCGSGGSCVAGVCQGGSGGDIGKPDTSGGDGVGSDIIDKPCTPLCKPNQCSDDGCGKPCGACPSGQACNGLTQICEICTPDCDGQVCGSNGCGGSCGVCQPGKSCDGAACVSACTFCPGGGCAFYGFEEGLPGWDIKGDVEVVAQMGPATPPQGAKMLRLSTGLSTAETSWAQKALCAPEGIAKLSFSWRLFSEEFEEYCGSTYQDTFTVALLKADGSKQVLETWKIDELCPKGAHECQTCGSKSAGLTKTDLKFDKGDVWGTPWQVATLSLPAGAASATLLFEIGDVGDSAYDTVVLVDNVTLAK